MSVCLVTGGAGFIGSHIVDRLISLGHEVVVLDNLCSGNIDNINKSAAFFEKNLNDNLGRLFSTYKFDYVFHTAAFINLRESITNPSQCFKDNVMGSINLIDYCIKNKIKKFIFSSTGGAIYSEKARLPCNEASLTGPLSPYGLSKLTIEEYLKISKATHGMDYVTLRYGNIYGARQSSAFSGVISIFIDNILNNKNLKIFGDGKKSRDFLFIDDCVDANMEVLNLNPNNDLYEFVNGSVCRSDIFNVSSGTSVTINDIAKILLEISGSNSKIEYLPEVLGEMMHTKIDSNKLSSATNWSAKTNIYDGIKKTFEYFKEKAK